jgi:hypothetical protein
MSERRRTEEEPVTRVCDFPPDSKSEELKILSKDARYFCRDCGRSAATYENLCRAEPLYNAW